MLHCKSNNNAFTLVEIIVVVVIVAVLALVAIQLYSGYVKDIRQNMAENLAATAATFLNSVKNAEDNNPAIPSFIDTLPATLNGPGEWIITMPSGGFCTFKCPVGAQIVLNKSAGTVRASIKGVFSSLYEYETK